MVERFACPKECDWEGELITSKRLVLEKPFMGYWLKWFCPKCGRILVVKKVLKRKVK